MTEHEQRSLAQILADLQELKRENAQLRADVTALQARQSARPAPAEQSLHAGHAPGRQEEASRPSRRGILRAAVGVAAAAAGAGALVEAGTGTALADNYGTFSTTTTSAPAVAVSALGSGTYGVQAVTDAGYAVYGYTTAATGYAIYGVNSYGGFAIAAEGSNGGGGLSAVTDYAIGVSGRATTTGIGVYAFSSGGEALFAEGAPSNATIHATAYGVSPGSPPGTSALFAEGGDAVAIYATSSLGSTAVVATATLGGDGVNGTSDTGSGVSGHSTSGSGVYAVASGSGTGVTAYSNTGDGVYGSSGTSNGVQGVSRSGTGVYGSSGLGEGIFGQGGSGRASIHAVANGVAPGTPPATTALFAEGGSSYGAYVTNGSSLATVTGTNSGSGVGVLGQGVYGLLGQGSSVGVVGTSSHGIGGYFQGLEAALHLVPTALAGAPTSGAHSKGDLILDSGAVLYVCTASGTPGTWQKVGSQ